MFTDPLQNGKYDVKVYPLLMCMKDLKKVMQLIFIQL